MVGIIIHFTDEETGKERVSSLPRATQEQLTANYRDTCDMSVPREVHQVSGSEVFMKQNSGLQHRKQVHDDSS